MNPALEIVAMPAPQWLFGDEISERQRLLFARLYLEHVLSTQEPLSQQSAEICNSFLDRCIAYGLELAIPREFALRILKQPRLFSWVQPLAVSWLESMIRAGEDRSSTDRLHKLNHEQFIALAQG